MMVRPQLALALLLATTCVMIPAAAQDDAPANIQVSVDGEAVAFAAPLLLVDMQVPLLPAGTFVAALGATSTWDAGAQRLDITSGPATVQMWVGRDWAIVNGMQQDLDLGLQTFSGAPYVPGAAVATLLGFDAQWDQTTLLLAVGTPAVMPDGPTVAATLLEVIPGPPATLLVRVVDSGQVGEAPLVENPVIQRGQPGDTPVTAQLADLQPGDLVEIVFDETNTGVGVRASYAQTLGTIASVQGNQLTMTDGASYPLGEGVAAYGSDGAPLHLLATVGQAAIITQNPQDNSVWRILAQRRGTPNPPSLAEPTIAAFSLPHYAVPLGEGDALEMRVVGTAGAAAAVALGNTGQSVNLPETAPGVYSGSMTVPAGMLIMGDNLVAQLQVGAASSLQVPGSHPVTIDGEAPVIGQPFPNNRSTRADPNTNLRVNFSDGAGVGVDESTATLSLDGVDVTAASVVSPNQIFYDPPERLAPGAHSATAQVADMVGNVATFAWTFEVPTVQVGILELTHDATEPLEPGDTITVTMTVAAPGPAASFSIAGVVADVPMPRVGETNTYQGSYTIEADDAAAQAAVTANFMAADGTPYEATAEDTVTVTTPVRPFAITTPQADVVAGRRITPAGTAPAGSNVRWTVSYQTFILAGDIASGTVRADAAGNWQAAAPVDLKLLLLGMADRYSVKAELLDAAGAVQQTETVEFRARD